MHPPVDGDPGPEPQYDPNTGLRGEVWTMIPETLAYLRRVDDCKVQFRFDATAPNTVRTVRFTIYAQ